MRHLWLLLLATPAQAQLSVNDGSCSAPVDGQVYEWPCTAVSEPELTFTASPNPVTAGQDVTLTWEGEGDCTVSAYGQTIAVLASDTMTVRLPQTVTATFACGDRSTSLTITVGESAPEPDPSPEEPRNPEPAPTVCGSPYRGVPDPCAALGFDVFADYAGGQRPSGNDLSCTGTAAAPCLIDATGVTFHGRTALSGAYAILQGGHVVAGSSNGAWFSARNCSHCVIRDLEVSGPGTDEGHSSAVGLGAFNVWLRGSIHGFGDNRQAAAEQDYHGMKLMGADPRWVLDAEIYDVSGDSVQCGDASRGACANVYIGGGYMHDNRENAIDIKDSRNVVVSGVRMEGFRPTQSSSGVALVIHDDAFDARILDNVVSDTVIGIVSSGMRGHTIEGNTVQASRTGIELRATTDLTVRDNTISAPQCVDVQGGASGEIQTGC